MSPNIDGISSIFRVSGHPDTIFTNESRFLEKSEKIAQYGRYIGKFPIYSTQIRQKKCRLVKKLKKKLADLSSYIADISVQVFPSFAFVCHFILFAVGEIGILS